MLDRNAIALALAEIATLLEVQGENRFRARAFRGAARALEQSDAELDALLRERRLEQVTGIGPATASVIRELATTGRSSYLQELRAETPPGLIALLNIPHLGATRIRALHQKLGITSLDELEGAAAAGRIAGLPGFGARTEKRILDAVSAARGWAGRRRLADAREPGARLLAYVAAMPGIERAELAGELRRACETLDGIDIVACGQDAARSASLERFLTLPGLTTLTHTDRDAAGHVADGFRLRLHCVPATEFATTLLFATGSHGHCQLLQAAAAAQGMALSAQGLFRAGHPVETGDEEIVYHTLGLAWVPPELREDVNAVLRAREAGVPALVQYEDLHGCFHCHTTYSDGTATVAQMAEAAYARGWRWLGIADHSEYAGYAGGLSPEEVLAQHEEIDAWNRDHGHDLRVFKGIEADILPDGRVDWEDQPELLARFDYVIGSVHSAFQLPRAEQTRRYLRAIANPYLTFLGHLTGRLLLSRQGCDVDVNAVLQAAAARGIGIEINADPHRMELDWRHWPAAKALGIATIINPDAHSPAQFDYLHNGIAIARKAGLTPGDVVNCGALHDVRAFLLGARRA
jgi:DNA polymerase (family 10)